MSKRSETGKERRRRARLGIEGWSGRYRLEAASAWRECQLVDISDTGAGFEAFMLPTDVVPRSTAELELISPSGDKDETIALRGTVRHITRSPEGRVRVGIEFLGLSSLETRLLGLFFRSQASRRPV